MKNNLWDGENNIKSKLRMSTFQCPQRRKKNSEYNRLQFMYNVCNNVCLYMNIYIFLNLEDVISEWRAKMFVILYCQVKFFFCFRQGRSEDTNQTFFCVPPICHRAGVSARSVLFLWSDKLSSFVRHFYFCFLKKLRSHFNLTSHEKYAKYLGLSPNALVKKFIRHSITWNLFLSGHILALAAC